MELIKWAKANEIDYAAVWARCVKKMSKVNLKVDISVIIPVRGRVEYHKIVVEYIFNAIMHTDKKVSFTFVEHDDMPPKHYWVAKSWVNTIFIPSDGQPFNKCLCHNIGVLYGPTADYYLFHDTDILVPPDFFSKIMLNMQDKDAVQTFTKRRLLMASQQKSDAIIKGLATADFHNYSPHDIKPAIPGAPGGSIFVTRQLLIDVGMWEDVFFTGYSVEDQFFFNKINLMGKFASCDNPPIELIHLWHGNGHQETTRQSDFDALDIYDAMNDTEKREYMISRKEYFSRFITQTLNKE